MLAPETIHKIEQFVHVKPRSMDELAKFLDKNWRTADRYVEEIRDNYGTVDTRTFREGTRGALKIVFWSGVTHQTSSVFQKELEDAIYRGKTKEDFRAFDIFQYVPQEHKSVSVSSDEKTHQLMYDEFAKHLRLTKKTVSFFSGDLSFLDEQTSFGTMFDILDDLVSKNISIKVVCRVDILGKQAIERLLALNLKYGVSLVEIRHSEQPLRASIVDKKIVRLKEVRVNDARKFHIYYYVSDHAWVDWISKLFWHMFSRSIRAEMRLEQLELLKTL